MRVSSSSEYLTFPYHIPLRNDNNDEKFITVDSGTEAMAILTTAMMFKVVYAKVKLTGITQHIPNEYYATLDDRLDEWKERADHLNAALDFEF